MNMTRILCGFVALIVLFPACDVHTDIGKEASGTTTGGAGAESGSSDDEDEVPSPMGAGETSGGSSTNDCDIESVKPKIIEFCEIQGAAAVSPAPGEIGASCSEDTQCNDGFCLYSYQCSVYCDAQEDCPFGFACEDTQDGDRACRQSTCDVPTSTADCVSSLVSKAEAVCYADCEPELTDWLTCITAAAPVCIGEGGCGVEQGLLDACCAGRC